MPRPVCIVASGGVPYVSSLDGPPATPVADGPPITLVEAGAPPICLVNDDGRFAVEVISGLQALYDPSDLTSLYQSRTGGSTGAVDSVVGIMLDKSEMGGKTAANFIAGQSELVSNGTFDSVTTGWTAGNATLTVDTGRLLVTGGVGGNGYAYQAIATVANRWYIATFDTTFGTESNALFRAGTSIGGAELVQSTWTVAGAKAVLFMATGTTSYLRIGQNNPSTGLTVYFDNVSVKSIPGYHALAPSDAARPILRAGYLDTDGVDDWMQIFPTLNLGEQWWHVGGWKVDTSSTYPFGLTNDSDGAILNVSASSNYQMRNAADSAFVAITGSATLTNAHVFTAEHNAAVVGGRVNGGAALTGVSVFDSAAATKGLALFSRQNNAGATVYDGRFYGGAFGTGALSSSDRAILERYVAGLTGVVL